MTLTKDIEFNQEYGMLDDKYRGERKNGSLTREYNLADAVEEAVQGGLISSAKSNHSLGGGKEALVFLADLDDQPVCVKTFRPYSATNTKRAGGYHHVTEFDMAMVMAKTEFYNLRVLHYFGVAVPEPIDYSNGLSFSMELVNSEWQDTFEPAPLLRHFNLKAEGLDPLEFLEEVLDLVELMFKKATMVHGDLSEFNILVADDKPVIIDVSQSRLVNVKTFAETPVRIRIDKALSVLERDVDKILEHFWRRYRVTFPKEDVMERLMSDLPSFAKRYYVTDQLNMAKKRLSRTFWMNPDKVGEITSVRQTAKDVRMHRKMQELNF